MNRTQPGISRRPTIGILVGLLLLLLTRGPVLGAGDETNRVLALIDYIGGDYHHAVQGGQVINADEYEEMSEFSTRALELFNQFKTREGGDKAGIEKNLRALAEHIKNKSGEDSVPNLARQIKNQLIKTYSLATHPKALPTYDRAKSIYVENCAQCHGETGKGDGPGHESMNPKTPPPANFTDAEFMAGLSPFKVYNTATFGIDNTAMPSFAALPDEQRWQVAFYVLALRFSAATAAAGDAGLRGKPVPANLDSVSTLATASDEELSETIKKSFPDAPGTEILAYLRRGLLEKTPSDPLLIARSLLGDAAALYRGGDKEAAYQKAIEAYLDGFEMAEPALFAKDAAFGRGLENRFTEFRNAIRQGVPPDKLQNRYQEMQSQLDEATRILAREDRLPSYYSFLNATMIILREGLEAALILAAILAVLKATGATVAIRYVHLGWILALVAGGLTWLAAQTVLTFSGQHRETMEGFISVFAAAALFYVGYWLHTRTEAKKWRAFIEHKVKHGVSGQRILGLVGISFFAVYREAFEVVLFYQALWFQNEANHGAVVSGFVAGLLSLLAVIFVILKLGLRIPLKHFFIITGTLLYIMAFIFAGNGIRELQSTGWAPSTPVDFPLQIPLLGMYPTLETLGAQCLMLLAFVATSVWMARQNHNVLRNKESFG